MRFQSIARSVLPMVIVVERLPITQARRNMGVVGSSMQHHVEGLGDGADSLQHALDEASQIAHGTGVGQGEALECRIVGARQNPGAIPAGVRRFTRRTADSSQ